MIYLWDIANKKVCGKTENESKKKKKISRKGINFEISLLNDNPVIDIYFLRFRGFQSKINIKQIV